MFDNDDKTSLALTFSLLTTRILHRLLQQSRRPPFFESC